jgi:hypothetical protein
MTRAGDSVVNEQDRSLRVSHAAESTRLKLPYGQWPGSILNEDQVYLSNDNISRAGIAARLPAQYLFG